MFVSIFLLYLVLGNCQGEKNLYIDASGLDTNPCDEAHPCKTLDKVFTLSGTTFLKDDVHIYVSSDLEVTESYILQRNLDMHSYKGRHKLTFTTGSISTNSSLGELLGDGFIGGFDVVDSTTTRTTIIDFPSQIAYISNTNFVLGKSVISVKLIQESTINIPTSSHATLAVNQFTNCTFYGNHAGKDIFNVDEIQFLEDNRFIDFQLTMTEPIDYYEVIFDSPTFTYSFEFSSFAKAIFLSNGTFVFSGASLVGFNQSQDKSSTLMEIGKNSDVKLDGQHSDYIKNHQVGSLFVIASGSKLQVKGHTVTHNTVNESIFNVQDEKSFVSVFNALISDNQGSSVFKFDEAGGNEDSYTSYEGMDRFEYFFDCSTTTTKLVDKTVMFLSGTSTITPYINGVKCSSGCVVSGYSSCTQFYEKYENPAKKPKKKDHHGGNRKWLDWGIPLFVGIGGLLLCGIFCVCFAAVLISGCVVVGGSGIMGSKRGGYMGLNDDEYNDMF